MRPFHLPAALLLCVLCACARDPAVFSGAASSAPPPEESSASVSVEAVSLPEEEPLRSEAAAQQLMSGVYYLEGTSVIEIEGLRQENTVTVAAENGDSSVKTTSDLSGALTTMRVVTIGGRCWLVNDTTQTCTEMDPAEMAGGFDTDFSGLTFEERGEGLFDGETLYYEQYSQNEDTIRFFFDGEGALVGLTRSIEDAQLAELTLRIRTLSGAVPAGSIALPSGYQTAP